MSKPLYAILFDKDLNVKEGEQAGCFGENNERI